MLNNYKETNQSYSAINGKTMWNQGTNGWLKGATIFRTLRKSSRGRGYTHNNHEHQPSILNGDKNGWSMMVDDDQSLFYCWR